MIVSLTSDVNVIFSAGDLNTCMKLEFAKWLNESLERRVRLFLESVSDDVIVQAIEKFAEQNPDQFNQLGEDDIDPLIQACKENILKRGARSPAEILDAVGGTVNVYLFRKRSPVGAARGEVGKYTAPAVQSPTKPARPTGEVDPKKLGLHPNHRDVWQGSTADAPPVYKYVYVRARNRYLHNPNYTG
jgi:hypothetical protein